MENTSFTKTDSIDGAAFEPVVDPLVDPVAPVVEQPAERRRFSLRRSRTDRMVSGVCGGVAEATGVDAALVRLGLVALTVLGAGSGVLLYIAAWVLIPEAE